MSDLFPSEEVSVFAAALLLTRALIFKADKIYREFTKVRAIISYDQSSMIPTILVAEDDPAVRQGIVDALTFSGYQVMAAADGRQAMNYALSTQYQLLLLDLVMPHYSGFEVLEALKRNRPGQPVIILSARGEEADRVKGLSMGADDYVVKPFSVRELLARVDAVLRRTTERAPQLKEFQFDQGVASFARREILYSENKLCTKKDKNKCLNTWICNIKTIRIIQ